MFSIACIALGMVISMRTSNTQADTFENKKISHTIPPENVTITRQEGQEYAIIFHEDKQDIYHIVDDLSDEERHGLIENAKDQHNSTIGLTNWQFNQAIQLIENEMADKGHIKDELHVENGFRGALRDLVTEHFIDSGDTIRTHYDKVDQLINYMNLHYKRTEKVTNGLSTVTYTEFGKTEQMIQTITGHSENAYEQLKKTIETLKDTKSTNHK